MLFEKAKERRNAQAQLEEAVINAARMIKEHEIQRIENLEKELSAIDHKQ